jgi:protein-S-isoprenylcysteine O-methyltransferase Ste14
MKRLGFWAGLLEASFLGLLFALQTWRIAPTLAHSPFNLALLACDALPLGLLFVRRPASSLSRSPADWLTAYAATAAPLLLAPGGHALVSGAVGATLMALGLAVHIYAKLWLWRSFGLVAANRGLQQGGPYRLVLHPIYLGNTVTQLGFLLLNPSLANVCICGAGLGLQLVRLRAEERHLSTDPAYLAYMKAVPFRLAPGLF